MEEMNVSIVTNMYKLGNTSTYNIVVPSQIAKYFLSSDDKLNEKKIECYMRIENINGEKVMTIRKR